MALAATLSPVGGGSAMVDKMIGTAFPKVKTVADNIDAVNYCVENMEAIVAVATELSLQKSVTVTGIAPSVGGSGSIPYPQGVTNSKLLGFTVLLVDSLGAIHTPGEFYTVSVFNNALQVSIKNGAPSSMAGGSIRWHIIYAA